MSEEDNTGDMEREVVGENSEDPECVGAHRKEETGQDTAEDTANQAADQPSTGSDMVLQDKNGIKHEDETESGSLQPEADGGLTEHAEEEKETSSKANETVDESDEEVDVGDVKQLTEDGRNILFGRGLVYERAGKKSCALKCYLACISHLTPQSNFVLLPQCLRNIADLYYRKEQYEKAILFIQAEKLFYENALIDTNEVQQKIESLQQGLEQEGTRSSEDAKLAADSLRADEYEHLAKLCVDKKQPQLALEYAGKATKLRQKIYGNDNPITQESLDFFATLYAEVGKQQYSDSMSHLSEDVEGGMSSPPVTPSSENSPSSILRQRRPGETDSDRKKQVRFQEPEGSGTASDTPEDNRESAEELISHTLLWMLFMVCAMLLGVLGMWLYCMLADTMACKWVAGELQYVYMRAKYFYYQYASTNKVKYT